MHTREYASVIFIFYFISSVVNATCELGARILRRSHRFDFSAFASETPLIIIICWGDKAANRTEVYSDFGQFVCERSECAPIKCKGTRGRRWARAFYDVF